MQWECRPLVKNHRTLQAVKLPENTSVCQAQSHKIVIAAANKAVPPLKDIFDMAGMNLPSFLGYPKKEEAATTDAVVVKDDANKQ